MRCAAKRVGGSDGSAHTNQHRHGRERDGNLSMCAHDPITLSGAAKGWRRAQDSHLQMAAEKTLSPSGGDLHCRCILSVGSATRLYGPAL
jgi:hypothetical protein